MIDALPVDARAPHGEGASVYDFIRKQSLDDETQTMEMPAEYMFKGVPKYEEIDDPVAEVLVPRWTARHPS